MEEEQQRAQRFYCVDNLQIKVRVNETGEKREERERKERERERRMHRIENVYELMISLIFSLRF